ASARRHQTLRVERHVAAAVEIGVDVQLVGRLVGREPNVTVRTRDTMRRPELGLEVGEEREHRRLDLRFVLLAVRLEVSLVVVRAQAEEETLEVALPTRERSEEHTSELQSRFDLVCRLLLEK